MANKTSIEWTDYNWNFLRGCSRVSEGCRNCYAEGVAARFSGEGMAYEGLAKFVDHKPRWTGEISFHEDILTMPMRWTKPRKIFVNSMSDLFHEKVKDEWLDMAFAVMTLTPHHTYQILTKRPERMKEYMSKWSDPGYAGPTISEYEWLWSKGEGFNVPVRLKAPHIWLGVSVEDQKTADDRIPILLDTPAAIRWISAEPLLGPLNLTHYLYNRYLHGGPYHEYNNLEWVVVGGESGSGARTCPVQWIRTIVRDCRAAGVPVFVKQLGAVPVSRDEITDEMSHAEYTKDTSLREWVKDKKGGDITEFPPDLQVRQYPAAV
jgi:protein gp37